VPVSRPWHRGWMAIGYVGLRAEGWADAHVELGGEPFACRSGPRETALDEALGWARSIAARVLIIGPAGLWSGLWSAGSERLPDVPRQWPPPDYVPSAWPAVRPARAQRWRAVLQLGLEPDDPEFLAAMAEALAAQTQPLVPRRELVELAFEVAGGPLDEQTRRAEEAIQDAWKRAAARLGREPGLTAFSLKQLDPIGGFVPSRPTIALIDGFDVAGDGRQSWAVTFHGRDAGWPEAPDLASFADCFVYARQRADIVLARNAMDLQAPYVRAERPTPPC
jgi:hypothetical protein